MASLGRSSDPQRQILTLIRDFATERSQGERRVFDLRKRLQDLRSELDSSSALSASKLSLDDARRALNSSELELSLASSSIVSQQERIRALQDEIAKVGGEIADLKEQEASIRDKFVADMLDLNKRIRAFQASFAGSIQEEKATRVLASQGSLEAGETFEEKDAPLAGHSPKNLENEIACTNHQIDAMKKEYQEALCENDEVMQLMARTERRVYLVEAVMEEMKQLQDLGKQTSETEKKYAYLGEELKKRYTCPGCQLSNMSQLEVTF